MKIEISDNKKWQHSLTIRMIVLAFMGLFLLAPLEMIKSVIQERQKNAENVKKEIASQWAGKQIVSGPVLNIPYKTTSTNKESEPIKSVFHLMPEKLNISGKIETEKRHRSIYQSVVYTADLNMTGEFLVPEINTGEPIEILWNEAYYTMGISDNRGIKGEMILKENSTDAEAIPGLKDSDLFPGGISFPSVLTSGTKQIPFSMKFSLSGSESLGLSPAGKTTEVNMVSSWGAPGFSGKFLPAERTINESGFNAKWLITNLNRNFPQSWTGKSFNPESDSFGVDFILQVDHYQKSLRSAKYGILFIALTFLALIFAELTIAEPIHIFNYLLVALGLVLFFSLLNSLSEHLGFNLSYLISASATITMIILFLKALLKNLKVILLTGGLLVILYVFIYILLTLNDYAYLAGNVGLFILLAVTMILSVRLNLFNMEKEV